MPNQINLHASLDPDEAEIFLQVLSQLLVIPTLTVPRRTVVEKVHDSFSADIREYEKNKDLWIIEIRTKSGSKRGEFTGQCDELAEMMMKMESKNRNFIYDFRPANSDLRRTLQINRK